MAFNFEVNPVAINSTSKTVENLVKSIKLQDKIVEIDSNGQEIVTADSGYDGLGKVTINTDVPTVGSGFDFSGIGYDEELQQQINDVIQAEINYSKQKYSEWDPNITTAARLYKGDTRLIYAPNIDTSKVEDMTSTFENCNNLKVVPDLNTAKVTDMARIFTGCVSLIEQPNFDYSKVTDFMYAFADTSIKRFNLTFDECASFLGAFQKASEIQEITINNGNVSVNLSYFFNEANVSNIRITAGGTPTIAVSSLDHFMNTTEGNCNFMNDITFDISACTKMDYAFNGSNITVTPKFEGSFVGSSVMKIFSSCRKLIEVKDIDFGSATYLNSVFAYNSKLTTIGLVKVPNVTTAFTIFNGCSALTTIAGLEGLKVDMSFADSPNLSNESIQNLIDTAADVSSTGTKTMTFNATPFATITEEQRAAATAKGWSLVSA